MRTQVLMFTVLVLSCVSAEAQIYSCRAADGTRIFSDERCGPDAKIVSGVMSKKPSSKKAAGSKVVEPKVVALPKTAGELQALLMQCDAGDVSACNAWTRGGGPNQLRERERQSQLACEGGSLADCEERYCSDGASDHCRAKVLATAKVKGESWYLRKEGKRQPDGSTRYDVRCFRETTREMRDVSIVCGPIKGMQRCSAAEQAQASGQLEVAASNYCASL